MYILLRYVLTLCDKWYIGIGDLPYEHPVSKVMCKRMTILFLSTRKQSVK